MDKKDDFLLRNRKKKGRPLASEKGKYSSKMVSRMKNQKARQ